MTIAEKQGIKKLKKEEIASKLREILMYYGCKPGMSHNSNWDCLENRHSTHRATLTIKGDVCCCGCGIRGDAINVIHVMEGYPKDKDGFLMALKKGYEILNVNIDVPYIHKRKPIKKEDIKRPEKDFSKIINEQFEKATRGQYKYFYERGITSDRLFSKIKPIVALPLFFPHENTPQFDNINDYRFIIPVWKGKKVVNCILRRDDKLSTHNNKVSNLKNLNVSFFNSDILDSKYPEIITITEGIFDALSFMQFNIESICLNSTSMSNKFCNLIKEKKDNLHNKVFVLALDNDTQGIAATNKIKECLKTLDIKYIKLEIKKEYKDINDYLVSDKDSFCESCYKMMEHCEQML